MIRCTQLKGRLTSSASAMRCSDPFPQQWVISTVQTERGRSQPLMSPPVTGGVKTFRGLPMPLSVPDVHSVVWSRLLHQPEPWGPQSERQSWCPVTAAVPCLCCLPALSHVGGLMSRDSLCCFSFFLIVTFLPFSSWSAPSSGEALLTVLRTLR